MAGRRNALFGVACGALCAVCLAAYGGSVKSEIEQQQSQILERFGSDQVEVYVATRDVAVGEYMSLALCEKQIWPGALVPDDAVDDTQVFESVVACPIFKGQIVLDDHFVSSGTVAIQVPEGLCALSVSAKAVNAVGGGVVKGSYVDVYATSSLGTDLLVADVLVLATSADEESSEISWITLALDPTRIEEVIGASQTSTLYFSLPSEDVRGTAHTIAQLRDAENEEDTTADALSEGGRP